MKFIPLIQFKRIYVGGGKASIQMQITSAIVTEIRSRGSTTLQTSTLQRLHEARPNLTDTVSAQLAKLSLDRQDQLLGAGQSGSSASEGEASANQPTFAGIAPTSQRQPVQQQQQQAPQQQYQQQQAPQQYQQQQAPQQYQQQQAPQQYQQQVQPGVLPTIPALNSQGSAVTDFTANAPMRIPGVQGVNPPSPTGTTLQFN
jgi:hypothetical protein